MTGGDEIIFIWGELGWFKMLRVWVGTDSNIMGTGLKCHPRAGLYTEHRSVLRCISIASDFAIGETSTSHACTVVQCNVL